LRLLLDCDAGGVFNVGSSRSVRVLDLAKLVVERTASASPIVFVPYERAHPAGFEELGNRSPDTSALRSLTGWVSEWTVEQTIASVMQHQLSQAPVTPLLAAFATARKAA